MGNVDFGGVRAQNRATLEDKAVAQPYGCRLMEMYRSTVSERLRNAADFVVRQTEERAG